MPGDFKEYKQALAMRDVIQKIITQELKRARPEYSYASVLRISRRNNTCRVAFPGDLGEADVRLGGVVPAHVGQVVRIDGLPNDRTIVDVMGPAADAWPGVVLQYGGDVLPHAGYLWADGSIYSMDTYPDLAYYRGYKDTYLEQVLAAVPSAYYRLGESSGTVAQDSSGNGLDATYTGAPTLGGTGALTGDSDTAVTFASGKYASRASGSSPWGASTVNQRFMGCWVYIADTAEKGCFLATNGVGIGCGNVDFTADGNHLIVLYNGVRWINTGLNMGTGWHHVGVSIGAANSVNVFYDGTLAYSDGLGGPAAAAGVTSIGTFSTTTHPWPNKVDEAVFINRFVYVDEVQRLYLRGLRQFDVTDMRSAAPMGLDAIGGGTPIGLITGLPQVLDGLVGSQNENHEHTLGAVNEAKAYAQIRLSDPADDIRSASVSVPTWSVDLDTNTLATGTTPSTSSTGTPVKGATDASVISHVQPSRLTNFIVKT